MRSQLSIFGYNSWAKFTPFKRLFSAHILYRELYMFHLFDYFRFHVGVLIYWELILWAIIDTALNSLFCMWKIQKNEFSISKQHLLKMLIIPLCVFLTLFVKYEVANFINSLTFFPFYWSTCLFGNLYFGSTRLVL